jgi:hypothetical protein
MITTDESYANHRHLDLSHNHITLNIQKQQILFQTIFTSLSELRNLNLGYNTLQDIAFDLILSLTRSHCLLDLEVLDLSKSYITAHSIPKIQALIHNIDMRKFRSLLLHQNIFTNDDIHVLKFPNKFKQNDHGSVDTVKQAKSSSGILSTVISSSDGFIMTMTEPIHKVVKVVLDSDKTA